MSSIKDLIDEHISSATHLSKKHVHPRLTKMLELGGMNVAFQKAHGPYFYDNEDNRYLDLLSGGGVYFVGRNHPQIREAIREVNEMDLPNLCVVNSSILGGVLAEKLIEMASKREISSCIASLEGI